MDAKIVVVSELSAAGFFVAQFKTSELAIFSYYVESAGSCVLIDPTLDVKAYADFIASRQATLKATFLSHYHADYLSGHTQFKVPTIMGKTAKRPANSFEVVECEDGHIFPLG